MTAEKLKSTSEDPSFQRCIFAVIFYQGVASAELILRVRTLFWKVNRYFCSGQRK